MAGCSAEDYFWVAEATILRKAECIVIMWCSTIMLDYSLLARYHVIMRLCVCRGGEVTVDSKIPLLDHCYELVHGEIVFCVTLRKHRVFINQHYFGETLFVH